MPRCVFSNISHCGLCVSIIKSSLSFLIFCFVLLFLSCVNPFVPSSNEPCVDVHNATILSSNMQSLHAKFSELLAFVTDLQSAQFNFSVLCIQESWLHENETYHKSNWKTTHVSHKENQVALKRD